MVEFRVKADEIVDLFEIDEGRDVSFELSGERRFDGIDERDFFVANQISVVRCAETGVVAVKIAHVVVNITDLVDSRA